MMNKPDNRWPAELGPPDDPIKNMLYARAMSALYRDGQRPSDEEVEALAKAYALDAMAEGPQNVVDYADRRDL